MRSTNSGFSRCAFATRPSPSARSFAIPAACAAATLFRSMSGVLSAKALVITPIAPAAATSPAVSCRIPFGPVMPLRNACAIACAFVAIVHAFITTRNAATPAARVAIARMPFSLPAIRSASVSVAAVIAGANTFANCTAAPVAARCTLSIASVSAAALFAASVDMTAPSSSARCDSSAMPAAPRSNMGSNSVAAPRPKTFCTAAARSSGSSMRLTASANFKNVCSGLSPARSDDCKPN